MKKVIKALSIVAILSVCSQAENLDGTLAVDTLKKYNIPSDDTLSTGMGDMDGGKDMVQATSTPTSTQSYSSSSRYLEGPFIGFEFSPFSSLSADGLSNTSMSFGLRFGAQNVDWRTMAVLEKMTGSDDDLSYARGLLQFDYFFFGMDNIMLDTYAIRPYVGLNAGVAAVDTNNESIKTLTYGAEAGASMVLSNQFDLDVSYRYNLHSSDSVSGISTLTAGIHYKY